MNSLLEYIMTNACGFLLLRPFVPDASDRRFPRLGAGGAYLLCRAPGTLDWGPGSLPWVDKRGRKGRQVVKSYLPALNHRVENRWRVWSSGLIFFMFVAPPLQPEVVGPFPGMGSMVPQLFAIGGNRP
jgi:hypothetical protein